MRMRLEWEMTVEQLMTAIIKRYAYAGYTIP